MTSLRRPRSSSDASDSERPNRRQRLESEPNSDASVAPLIRDELFYKDGGDCYLQVETHLFKIHRYHLTRGDASVFNDMFLLPSGTKPCQGSTESNPIVLAGDTAERFRGFLTIAYAEPLEFQVAQTRLDQVPTLIHCAHFSHKYNITPLLLAALEAMVSALSPTPELDPHVYISLLGLSKLCAGVQSGIDLPFQYKIRFAVELGWISSLIKNRDFRQISEALDVGEEYDLHSLLKYGYSYYLEKMALEADAPTDTGLLFSPFQNHTWLKPVHRLRILTGLWSQERTWSNFVATVPAFPAGHKCPKRNHNIYCVSAWEQAFRRAVTSPSVLAVPFGAFTSRMLKLKAELKPAFESSCISMVLKLEDLLKGLKHGSDHFETAI